VKGGAREKSRGSHPNGREKKKEKSLQGAKWRGGCGGRVSPTNTEKREKVEKKKKPQPTGAGQYKR